MAKNGRATLTRAGYYAYLKSPEWQAVKRRYLKSKLPKECHACGKRFGPGFHFHHKTYKNLGNEYLRDIIPMCGDCHFALHDWHETNDLPLWQASNRFCRAAKKGKKPRQPKPGLYRRGSKRMRGEK